MTARDACGPAAGPGLVLLRAAASERNVVVRGAGEVLVACRGCGGHELALAVGTALTAAAEELNRVGDDLDRLALAAVLRLPLAPVEPAVDPHGAALGEVLRATLALVAPDRHVEVVGLVSPVALRILLAGVDGTPELADGRAARGVPQLGVLREVADEHDAIDVGHGVLLLFRTHVRFSIGGLGDGLHNRLRLGRRGSRRAALDAPHRQMAHHAVRDPEDPRELLE